MTRRDYVLIAAVLRDTPSVEHTSRVLLVRGFARALVATNPRFDAVRFVRECLRDEEGWVVSAALDSL